MTREEQIAADLFRIADKHIWLEDFIEFQAEVKKLLAEKYDIDLGKIYYDSPGRIQE